MVVPPVPLQVSSQRPLAQSVTSASSVTNDKDDMDDNEMIPGAVHRYPDINFIAEKTPGKPQLGRKLSDQSSPPMGFLISK